jgi:hypothetical protein
MRSYFGLVGAAWGILISGVAKGDPALICCGNDPARWEKTNSSVVMNLGSSLTASEKARASQLAAQWAGPSTAFDWVTQNDNDTTWNSGENEIGWSSRPLGVTFAMFTEISFDFCETCDSWTCGGSSCEGGRVKEADIRIMNDLVWNFNPPVNYLNETGHSVPQDTWDVALLHELGHAAGLGHSNFMDSNGGMSRMESHLPAGGWFNSTLSSSVRVTPFAQDMATLAGMYPGTGSLADLYVANMQHIPSNSPETQVNSVPLSWDTVNSVASWYPQNTVSRGTGSAAEKRRTAKVGDLVNIRGCFGNTGGATFGTTSARYWLSTNDSLGGGDAVSATVWTWGSGLGANGQWCENHAFVVPNVPASASGTFYYIIIDINNAGANSNNWAVHNRRLKVIL